MSLLRPALLLWLCVRALAQEPCQGALAYSPCDLPFELSGDQAAAHPNPYLTVELRAEFRSPRYRTFLMPAFWDGGRRLVLRFAPTEPGPWTYRVTSNIPGWNGKTGQFTAAPSPVNEASPAGSAGDCRSGGPSGGPSGPGGKGSPGCFEAPGFVKAANVHHFAYTGDNQPHLWMAATFDRFAVVEDALFRQIVDARARQKFNHIRGLVLPPEAGKGFLNPDQPDPAHFRRLDERIRYMNRLGIVSGLILGGSRNHLTQVFPTWQQRQRYLRYLVARYSPMNITWQGIQDFEEYDNGRELLKEIGLSLKQTDPYQHLRSTGALATSAPLLEDGWMDYIAYRSSPEEPGRSLGSIEHQLYPVPQVSTAHGFNDPGALRRWLWNTTMNGQYPDIAPAAGNPDPPALGQVAAWRDFFLRTRHWELEPYFDVDGGRAVALEGVEYVVYVEKPGPVELLVEKHGYDVAWYNPLTGETLKQKDWKGERFTGEPPTRDHDWVLHISREGRKEGMLRSWKFESRRIYMQEIERALGKMPFKILAPAGELSLSRPNPYEAKIERETRATRSMMWLWTGEVSASGRGFRVLGSGLKGALAIPAAIARDYPAILHLRVFAMNANGKVYSVDQTHQLTQ